MDDSHPEAAGLAIAGSVGLLGSTFATWFVVLVQYPTDESLKRYRIFGRAYGSLHDYSAFGRAFEVLTVLAGIASLLAILYGAVAANRMDGVVNILTASGAVALAVLVLAWITFEIADPLGKRDRRGRAARTRRSSRGPVRGRHPGRWPLPATRPPARPRSPMNSGTYLLVAARRSRR